MNNSLQIDNNFLCGCRVIYTSLKGETGEGLVRACWVDSRWNLVFLLELENGRFVQTSPDNCKRIYHDRYKLAS